MAVSEKEPTDAQRRFDETYITSSEIAKDLGVSRPSILRARQRQLLPEPIVVGDDNIHIWERTAVSEALAAWKLLLQCRRGCPA